VISRKEGERVVAFNSHTRIKADAWEITYGTAQTPANPRERLTVVHSAERPNRYLYFNAAAARTGALVLRFDRHFEHIFRVGSVLLGR
jgi:hypothetical protein